jgi:hypothetical protein
LFWLYILVNSTKYNRHTISQHSVQDFRLQYDDILDNSILNFNSRCRQYVGFVSNLEHGYLFHLFMACSFKLTSCVYLIGTNHILGFLGRVRVNELVVK